MTNQDIKPILDAWPHNEREVMARYVECTDSRQMLQLRVDLGLLQLELDGRPDGRRPHDFESLLHYHRQRLEHFRGTAGTDAGFSLTEPECEALRQEALQYYYRYLGCFQLGDHDRVIRDTARNLEVFDLVRDHAAADSDQVSQEPFRPYVLMMHHRARAERARSLRRYDEAVAAVLEGIEAIRAYLEQTGRGEHVETCGEVAVLRQLAEELIKEMPDDPLEQLRGEMKRAVAAEDYERAALLRDEIRRLQQSGGAEAAHSVDTSSS